jgi:hypothetical protein
MIYGTFTRVNVQIVYKDTITQKERHKL